MMVALLKRNARFHWPLFHVQPCGSPFMAQRKSGLPARAASARAASMSRRQGICFHRSSQGFGSTVSIFWSSDWAGRESASRSNVRTIPRSLPFKRADVQGPILCNAWRARTFPPTVPNPWLGAVTPNAGICRPWHSRFRVPVCEFLCLPVVSTVMAL